MQSIYPKIIEKNNTSGKIQYKMMTFLGNGGFADCYLVSRLNDGKLFAAKITSKKKMNTRKNMESRLRCEIQIMRRLKHQNIVSFQDTFQDQEFVYIIMEYCQKISLYQMLRNRHTLTEHQIKYFLKQLMLGLKYLHSNSIIHRDIKICNIMLNSKLQIKIGDFGLATYWNQNSFQKQPTVCGTPNYMSPEVIRKVPYSFEVDIWSSGVLMYNLRFGRCPFTGVDQKQTYQNILRLKYKFPETQIPISKHLKNLIKMMLHPHQKQRISLQQILNHEFLKQNIPPQLPRTCYKKCPSNKSISKLIEQIKFKNYFMMKRKNTSSHLQTPSTNQKRQSSQLRIKNEQAFIDEEEIMFEPILILNNTGQFNYINLSKITFIKQFTDNSKQYGFCFHLSNMTTGILFNDKTSMYMKSRTEETYYKEGKQYKKENLKYCNMKQKKNPIFWRKFLTLKCYNKKFRSNCYPNENKQVSIEKVLRTVRSWGKVYETYMFCLKDIIQVIFEDQSTIIYVKNQKTLLYLERDKVKCYLPPFEDFINEGHKNRFKIFDNFMKMLHNKRCLNEQSE